MKKNFFNLENWGSQNEMQTVTKYSNYIRNVGNNFTEDCDLNDCNEWTSV